MMFNGKEAKSITILKHLMIIRQAIIIPEN